MYFLIKGTWAICFNNSKDPNERQFHDEDDDDYPEDVILKGLIKAKVSSRPNYIGDYYCINSKKARYYYMAWNETVHAFALTKQFLNEEIFTRYPQLFTDMKGASFLRYTYEFKKPIVTIMVSN